MNEEYINDKHRNVETRHKNTRKTCRIQRQLNKYKYQERDLMRQLRWVKSIKEEGLYEKNF